MTKFNVGDRVWVVKYDDSGLTGGIHLLVFLGANDDYAFLAPIIGCGQFILSADDLCKCFYHSVKKGSTQTDILVYPLDKCFATTQEAFTELADEESK